MKQLLPFLCAATFSFGLLSGCASTKPDFGDQVSSVSKNWNKGEALVKDGEARVKSGKADIKAGERDLGKADDAVARWTTRLRGDRQAYADAVALTGTATSGAEIEAESDALKRLKKSIAKSESELKTAKRAQSRSRDRIAEGKARLRKGDAQIDDGKARMKRAEREYRKVID